MEAGVQDVWPQSDLEMFDFTVPQYINQQPFSVYYHDGIYSVNQKAMSEDRRKMLHSKLSDNFYYLDDEQLYLGTIKLSNKDDIDRSIKNLEAHISHNFATKDEIQNVQSEIQIEVDENAFAISQLKNQVKALEEKSVEEFTQLNSRVLNLENSNDTNIKDIINLKTDIATLKTISSGFGGDGEPSTILAAIQEAEENAKTFADELMSWKED